MSAKTSLTTDQPWPGAAPYGLADRPYFHGRRRETEELMRLLHRDVVTLVLGAKGVGKTSLIHAGLLPSLSEGEWLPVIPVLDWTAKSPKSEAADINAQHPMSLANPLTRQLLSALNVAASQRGLSSPEPDANETLWEFFHRAGNRWWSSRQRVVTPVIIIDAFEAVFTTARQNATGRRHAEAFLQELSQLAANRPPQRLVTQLDAGESPGGEFDFETVPIRIVLVIGEEFTAELGSLHAWFPTLRHCELRIEAFTPSQAREVLMRGALQGSLFTEAALDATISQLAKHAGADGRISPARLSALAQALAAERKKRATGPVTPDFLPGTNPPAIHTAPALESAPAESGDLRAQLAAAEQGRRRSNRLATIAFLVAIAAFAIPQMLDHAPRHDTAATAAVREPTTAPQPADVHTPTESTSESPFSTQPAEYLPPITIISPTPAPTPAPFDSAQTTPLPATPVETPRSLPGSQSTESAIPTTIDSAPYTTESLFSPDAQRQLDAAAAERKAEQERMKREFLKRQQDERTRRPATNPSPQPRRSSASTPDSTPRPGKPRPAGFVGG